MFYETTLKRKYLAISIIFSKFVGKKKVDMKAYRVIIAGSRKFDDYAKLQENCDHILQEKLEDKDCRVVIVSGHARGADTLGERYAHERGLGLDAHPADWELFGRAAGIIRNREMAEVADALIAFLQEGEENKGTRNMIAIARNKQMDVFVVQ